MYMGIIKGKGETRLFALYNFMKKPTSIFLGLLLSATLIPAHFSYADQQHTIQAISTSENGIRVARDSSSGLFGYIDEEGNQITPMAYTAANAFVDGIGLVKDSNGVFSAINNEGRVITNFKKELGNITLYGDYGTASLSTGRGDLPEKYALIDKNGNLLTGYDYAHIGRNSYYDKAMGKLHYFGPLIVTKNKKYGIMDPSGKLISPLEYDSIQASSEGEYDIYSVGKKVGNAYKYGYIDGNGKILIGCNNDAAGDFTAGYGMLQRDGKYAVVNTNGTIITDFAYDSMDIYREGLAPVQKNGLWGCIDTNGNLVILCKYDSMGYSENGNIDFYLQDGKTEVKITNPLIDQRDINIYLNGKWIYSDQAPVIQNARTLAPFRAIAESLGYTVDWDNSSQSVTLQNANKIIHLKIGSNEAIVNTFDDGKPPETVKLDAPANLISGRTFVPVRFLAENIGAEVIWNKESRTIDIKN